MQPQMAADMLSPDVDDALHQHRIDAHADHNEEGLETQGQQGSEGSSAPWSPTPG